MEEENKPEPDFQEALKDFDEIIRRIQNDDLLEHELGRQLTEIQNRELRDDPDRFYTDLEREVERIVDREFKYVSPEKHSRIKHDLLEASLRGIRKEIFKEEGVGEFMESISGKLSTLVAEQKKEPKSRRSLFARLVIHGLAITTADFTVLATTGEAASLLSVIGGLSQLHNQIYDR